MHWHKSLLSRICPPLAHGGVFLHTPALCCVLCLRIGSPTHPPNMFPSFCFPNFSLVKWLGKDASPLHTSLCWVTVPSLRASRPAQPLRSCCPLRYLQSHRFYSCGNFQCPGLPPPAITRVCYQTVPSEPVPCSLCCPLAF